MNTVFPVEIELPGTLLQAFTRDVSAGGMCLELKSFGKRTEEQLQIPDLNLQLTINPVFSNHPVNAVAKIVWLKKEVRGSAPVYLIGVQYTQIDAKAQRRLIRYAKRLRWIPRLAAAAGLALLTVSLVLFGHGQRLIQENKVLVRQLVESAEKKSAVSSELFGLQKKKMSLDRELLKAQQKIQELESSKSSASAELKTALEQQSRLHEELNKVQASAEQLAVTYQNLETQGQPAAATVFRQMAEWLKSHQNLRTGLVASFEGDAFLEDWAFTYDESLACQVFLLFGDTRRAEAILMFYEKKASRQEQAFFNAYDTVDGRAVENTVHVGPNIWLGIAALQYEALVKDGRFLPLARRIGDWAISQQDAEGGLKGGPGLTWYSTEHNLDAYAFFSILYRQTQDERYHRAQTRVLDWIKKYAYSVKEKRINRGKGDATIATDTFSWSIASLGPQRLQEIQFDSEEIMEFAEEHCEVEVFYKPSYGKAVRVRGFDFAKAENIGRGGVISTEWTAQVIVTYRILSDYFKASGDVGKAAAYRDKANFYLTELQKLIITSPSRTGQGRGCLPYASAVDVDTGHGWRTPKGSRTGSVAGTAYGIFAWAGYNPFSLENKSDLVESTP